MGTSSKEKGWLTARPLEKYSSLHELSLTGWMGLGKILPKLPIFIEFNFNLHSPFRIDPKASLAFQTHDAYIPGSPLKCFTITHTRWRADISSYSTFDEFPASLSRWHRCNYLKSEKTFKNYGCTVTVIEDDWTEHVDVVYKLYCNVAKKHGDKLYDICFFREIAKRDDYKLICAWFEGEIISMFVLEEELPTIHSICCGMDYDHSSRCYAYSWLHYELIRFAIETKKYKNIDVGMSADNSKRGICFSPVPSHMDICAKSVITRSFLKFISSFVTGTITPDAKLKLKLRKLPRHLAVVKK